MPDNKIALNVVVNGQAAMIEANVHAPIRAVVPKALEESGNIGQPPENWELRDADGNLLDLGKKVEDFAFAEGATLYLSLKAGAGG